MSRDVVGVDLSEAMLARARAKLPGVDLRRGELTALPFDDGAFAGGCARWPSATFRTWTRRSPSWRASCDQAAGS